MSDAIWIAIVVAVGQAFTAWQQRQTHTAALVAASAATKAQADVAVVKSDMAVVKTQTNHLSTLAVDEAKSAGLAQGTADERAVGAERAAAVSAHREQQDAQRSAEAELLPTRNRATPTRANPRRSRSWPRHRAAGHGRRSCLWASDVSTILLTFPRRRGRARAKRGR